jgi:hypothetical protein
MRGLKENWFKVGVLIALLLAAGSIAYYLLVAIPQQQQQIAAQKATQAIFLQDCLAGAKTDAEQQEFIYCETSGTENTATCQQQLPLGGSMLSAYQASENVCFQEYPQS